LWWILLGETHSEKMVVKKMIVKMEVVKVVGCYSYRATLYRRAYLTESGNMSQWKKPGFTCVVVVIMLMVLVMLVETLGQVKMIVVIVLVAEVVMLMKMELGQHPGCRCDLSHTVLH